MNDKPERDPLTRKKINTILWTCVAILIILLLITTIVVVINLCDLLPENTNILFLVPKIPSFEIGDGEGTWNHENTFDIFETAYDTDGNGYLNVVSSDGNKVIAPGVETGSSFRLDNSGNVAIDYDVDMRFKFTIDGEPQPLDQMPIRVRVLRNDGVYVAGNRSEWVAVADMPVVSDSGTLGVQSFTGYTLELKWDFNSGDDAHDTYLGDLSVDHDVRFSLDISSYATESEDPRAVGGTFVESEDGKTVQIGGSINWLPFILLLIAILGLALGITRLAILKKSTKAPIEPQ